jgi:predicted ATP-dependent Lon-type protease
VTWQFWLLPSYEPLDEKITTHFERVKEILRRYFVQRSEAGLVRSTIRERGPHKVIDNVSVDLNDKRDVYEATFANRLQQYRACKAFEVTYLKAVSS